MQNEKQWFCGCLCEKYKKVHSCHIAVLILYMNIILNGKGKGNGKVHATYYSARFCAGGIVKR